MKLAAVAAVLLLTSCVSPHFTAKDAAKAAKPVACITAQQLYEKRAREGAEYAERAIIAGTGAAVCEPVTNPY